MTETRRRGPKASPPAERPLYRLVEHELGSSLANFVASRRPDRIWREIAEELTTTTGITVTEESLRRWFAGRITYEAKVAS